MRRKFKIAPLLMMLLACAIAGLWQAEGRRGVASSQQSFASPPAPVSKKPHANMTIRVRLGSFVMKDLMMQRAGSSTILKGKVSSTQSHLVNQATFEIRAYDHTGARLRGVEEKTIFTVRHLKARASLPLNSGHGVWLQGISLDRIARLEVIEAGAETAQSSLAHFLPFASHAVDWKRYSEIEE
jgi:hypothetical protein